jgi:ABC-2 type transport system permease protein
MRSRGIYLTSTVFSVVSSALAVLIQLFLWKALAAAGVKNNISFDDMAAYVAINAIMLALTNSNLANEIGASIRDGSVVNVFTRPASFELAQLFTMLGGNMHRLLATAIPAITLTSVFARFPLPSSAVNGLVFLPLAITGIIITFLLIYLTGLYAFWLQKTWYLSFYLRAGFALFGGTTVPIWFYPDMLERVSRVLPFRYITFEAINCYLGKTPLSTSIEALLYGLIWVAALQGLVCLVWRGVNRKVCYNGG